MEDPKNVLFDVNNKKERKKEVRKFFPLSFREFNLSTFLFQEPIVHMYDHLLSTAWYTVARPVF
jgi:hypothetical protein